MTVWNRKLMPEEEDELPGLVQPEFSEDNGFRSRPGEPVEDAVLRDITESNDKLERQIHGGAGPDPAMDAWVKAHPQGLDLGSNEKEIERLRSAKRSARPKPVAVGRPDMPGAPRAFAEIQAPQPREEGVEVADVRRQAAPAESAGSRPHDDMLDAELMASGRRQRAGVAQAARMIGRAGLAKNPQSAALDAQEMGQADRPVAELQGRRAETRKQADDARQVEDQGFQRNQDARAGEQAGFTAEKAGREREYNSPKSGVSQRRRSELMGLYGKQVAKIPYADFQQLSAADVDVLMKELQQERATNASNRGSAAMERAFAAQVAKVGDNTAKAPYGEIESLAKRFEELSPGITSGKGTTSPLDLGSKVALALPGGIGEGLASDDALQMHKAQGEVIDLIERMRSGAVINDSEAKHYTKLIGGGVMQDPRSMSMGLQTVFTSLRQKMKNAQGGYTYLRNNKGQSPLDVFSEAGGTDYRKGPTAGGRTITMPDGRKFRELPDGSAEEVR